MNLALCVGAEQRAESAFFTAPVALGSLCECVTWATCRCWILTEKFVNKHWGLAHERRLFSSVLVLLSLQGCFCTKCRRKQREKRLAAARWCGQSNPHVRAMTPPVGWPKSSPEAHSFDLKPSNILWMNNNLRYIRIHMYFDTYNFYVIYGAIVIYFHFDVSPWWCEAWINRQ